MERAGQREERLKGLAVSDNGFLFDTWTGNTYSLNQTGLFILKRLQAGQEVEAIAGALSEEYGVEEETTRLDVEDFMEQLVDMRLVDGEEVRNDA